MELGQQVQAGQTLCQLADHRQLAIEGKAFQDETPLLERSLAERWEVEVDFDEDPAAVAEWEKAGVRPAVKQAFLIERLSNTIDPATRTFTFRLPLANQSREVPAGGGPTQALWRYRPGQRGAAAGESAGGAERVRAAGRGRHPRRRGGVPVHPEREHLHPPPGGGALPRPRAGGDRRRGHPADRLVRGAVGRRPTAPHVEGGRAGRGAEGLAHPRRRQAAQGRRRGEVAPCRTPSSASPSPTAG